jgi:hypothetical protein
MDIQQGRSEEIVVLNPKEPTAGAIGAFARPAKLNEIKELELKPELRLWEVRAFISDSTPLAGDGNVAFDRSCYHLLYVNPSENPLWMYLHQGGRNAVYYGLFGDENGKLQYISVKVQSRLPSNAVLLARGPVNALLDVFTRNHNMPLVIQRLDVISPTSGDVLLSEFLIPERKGVMIGPIGGVMQSPAFAPYDALYREALTSSSPFYRLLCAWKMYEGTDRIRGWVRKQSKKQGSAARLPPDPVIDPKELVRLGFEESHARNIKCARDLFEKLREPRNAISHFLIDTDAGESHVYVADGRQLRIYAIGASALLRYAHQALEDLRIFCGAGVPGVQGGTILPLVTNRDQFFVRAEDYGLR